MNIVVSIRQAPNINEVKLNQATGTLIRKGVSSIISPNNKAGPKTTLRLRDQIGAHTIALTAGPPQAAATLCEIPAIDADEAIPVTDHIFGGVNTQVTSPTLASAIAKPDYDLIITSRQVIDGDTAQVGPQIAGHLGLPSVSYVEELWMEGDTLKVKRQYEDRYHIIHVKTPCLITVLVEVNEPCYMASGGIFDAFQKEIAERHRADLDIDDSNIGLKGSPTRVEKSFTKAVKGQGTVVTMEPEEPASWLTDRLREKFIPQ